MQRETTKKNRKISLVVPLRNEEETLPTLFASIARQTRQPDEIVLVDGGSTDGTTALMRRLADRDARIRIVEAGEATPGRGRNIGISTAAHEWVALTDAGLTLEPDWLEELARAAFADPDVEVVYGNYEPVTDTLFARCAALAYPPPKQERAGGRMRGPSTASMMLRREVWQRLGGFPDLRAAEDLLFMQRIERAGCRVAWSPRATVWWQMQPGFRRTFRKFVLYSKHNVWAGLQADWHYGVARQYALYVPFVLLALVHRWWWLVPVVLLFAARVARAIWRRREGRDLLWALHPVRFAGVALVLLTIDAATFVGWAQALRAARPARADGTKVEGDSRL
ncbi:MAG TPA: glycosyltransferase [Pyrinomonadaceae bacterium]|nr:glycosyltransferase [Pyrinomonadaceae bacterium]